jgi:glycosyltransferase involved in cell wall biosynthesis
MRIIHITFSLCNGGKENLLVDIANEQAKATNMVTIIIINNLFDNVVINRISTPVNVICLKRGKAISSIFAGLKLYYFLKFKLHPDVIHCHDISLGKQLSYFTRCKTVITIHGLGLPIEQLGYFDKIFCISETVKKDIERRSSYKCLAIYNGIYTNMVKRRPVIGLGNTIKIVQVSNLLHEFKGQDVLINAMNILVNEKGVKNLHLDLVGEGLSRLLLEQMIKDFNLTEYVFLLGSKSRDWVYENLCVYDVFIQASRNEGFGLTVAEAMAAKLPIIASKHDGPAEILGYGKYGLLFENDNSIDLAAKILEVIYLYDSGKIFNIVDLAYTDCNKNFGIKTTTTNYLNSY